MNNLVERIQESIRAHGLLHRRQAILVAVSGGVDSMVLLHLLHELSRQYGWHLTVAHLNHQLRGRSSDADERLVVRTARKLHLPIVVERADVKGLVRARGLSIEMAAREARHAFLARAAARLKTRAVAVAHHADDQVELFFLRLLRGVGSEGLAGMKWRNPSPADARIELVRPLLDQPKARLREYAAESRIPFREDASNVCLDMRRNRIRHELLPLLRRTYQSALDRTVLRLMNIAAAEAEFVNQVAGEWLAQMRRADGAKLASNGRQGKRPERFMARQDAGSNGRGFLKVPRRTRFMDLPLAVQRRCIHLQLLQRKVVADYDLVERVRTSQGRSVAVSAAMAVILTPRGELRLQKASPVRNRPGAFGAGTNNPLEVDIETGSGWRETTFGRLRIRWRIRSHTASIPAKARHGCECFDADKVGSKVVLRHWRPGDRFQPSGMSSPVKLQDLFTNAKIPREQRHGLVVVTTARGELVWVEKLRIAERFKLSNLTNRRLQWCWKKL